MQYIRAIKNNLFSPIEVKVREATCSDPWSASSTQMSEIAAATKDHLQYPQLIGMLWKRLTDHKNYMHVQKALILVEYLLRYGSERFVRDCVNRKEDIYKLRRYQFLNEDNVDVTKDVRKKARTIYDLLESPEALKQEREKASRLRTVKDSHYSNDTYNTDKAPEPEEPQEQQPQPKQRAPSSKPRASSTDPYDYYSNTSRVLTAEEERAARKSSQANPDDNPFDNEPVNDPFGDKPAQQADAGDAEKPKKKKKKATDPTKKKKKKAAAAEEAPAPADDDFDNAFQDNKPNVARQPSGNDAVLAAALGQGVVATPSYQARASQSSGAIDPVDLLTGEFQAANTGGSWENTFQGDDDNKNTEQGQVQWMDQADSESEQEEEPEAKAAADPWGLVNIDNINANKQKEDAKKKSSATKKGKTMNELLKEKPSVSMGTAIPGFESTDPFAGSGHAPAPTQGVSGAHDIFFSNQPMNAPAPSYGMPFPQAYPQAAPGYGQPSPYGQPQQYGQPSPYGFPGAAAPNPYPGYGAPTGYGAPAPAPAGRAKPAPSTNAFDAFGFP